LILVYQLIKFGKLSQFFNLKLVAHKIVSRLFKRRQQIKQWYYIFLREFNARKIVLILKSVNLRIIKFSIQEKSRL